MKTDLKQNSPRSIRARLDNILPHVSKPARYFAGEIGLVRKSWDDASVRVAVGFPDVYEVAAVNLGHFLIQQILNSREDFLCERVYSPWPDMEAKLRETQTPLYSLESYRPISSFDVFGVSITHELAFTNLLQLLDLAGLPLAASKRGFPIVIAGGPSVFNPEPISNFVDAFLLGDGEDASLQLAESIKNRRADIDAACGNLDAEIKLKAEILAEWGGGGGEGGKEPIQGVYVPSHFEIKRNEKGKIEAVENIAGGPSQIIKALVTDLENSPWIKSPPISHMQKVSSRVTVEPVRGCTHGCRFCQAGMIYRPWRKRSLSVVKEQAEELLKSTGLTEQSFLALSATDWPDLKEFISSMKDVKRSFHLKISLPSNRIGALDSDLASLIITNRKGGLTLAIEAATPRLRAVINKDVTDEHIKNAVTNALGAGWGLIKLYFMIGLPTETDDDVLEIIELVHNIMGLAKNLKREGVTNVARLRLKVSVSSFVPKSHTPFQWAPMDNPETLDRKQKLLIPLRKIKGVDYSSHDVPASRLEGILARGDRELSTVIEHAFKNGARFDAWSDLLDMNAWEKAFDETKIDGDSYLQGRDVDEILPWDHLSCGVDKEWLKKDWMRSQSEIMIPDCNESECFKCGMQKIYPECRPLRL